MSSIPHKHCNTCGLDKPIDQFSKKTGAGDGRQTQCKACVAAYLVDYYQRNKQQLHDKHRVYRKLYYECNRELLAEKRRVYQEAYPEHVRATKRAWDRRNPEKRKEGVLRRRARIRQNRVERVDYAVIWDRDQGMCHICGKPVDRSDVHFDHVVALVNGGAHSMDNIRVSHSICNMRKNRM